MIIWESEAAIENREDFARRNTVYRLTNTDPESKSYGMVMYHTAVTARKDFNMDKETFYSIVEKGLGSKIKVEPVAAEKLT